MLLWLSILESIPLLWKKKVKSHNMKITDDVSAGPSLNMTILLNNHSINWPEVYMIPQTVNIETSPKVLKFKLLNNIIYVSRIISKFDPCSLRSQAQEGILHSFCPWELLCSMLQWHIKLPDLDPTLALVGKSCIENDNNLIVKHVVLTFKKFLHDNGSNHSRIHTTALKIN